VQGSQLAAGVFAVCIFDGARLSVGSSGFWFGFYLLTGSNWNAREKFYLFLCPAERLGI
jgi:hypothetical protein